jgi:hypothetical protein
VKLRRVRQTWTVPVGKAPHGVHYLRCVAATAARATSAELGGLDAMDHVQVDMFLILLRSYEYWYQQRERKNEVKA